MFRHAFSLEKRVYPGINAQYTMSCTVKVYRLQILGVTIWRKEVLL